MAEDRNFWREHAEDPDRFITLQFHHPDYIGFQWGRSAFIMGRALAEELAHRILAPYRPEPEIVSTARLQASVADD